MYYGVSHYVSRHYRVLVSAVCEAAPPRSSRDGSIIFGLGFDDKILPIYTRRWTVTTGTAHPCVVYVWSI